MNKPTQLDMIRHLSEHYGLQFTEVQRIMRVPAHPADMRDEFAALAMQSLIASRPEGDSLVHPYTRELLAEKAYKMADTMLAERTKAK